MQEAKTNRNGLELKLHDAASGDDTSPLFCSNTQSVHRPHSPCTCLHGAVTMLSLNLKALLQGGWEHHQREHAALCKLGSFLTATPQAWRYSWPCGSPAVLVHVAPRGPAVARRTFCCPDTQLIPAREPAEDLAAPGQVSLLQELARGVTCSTHLGVALMKAAPSTLFNSCDASGGVRWSKPGWTLAARLHSS